MDESEAVAPLGGCYSNTNGILRVADQCRDGESAISLGTGSLSVIRRSASRAVTLAPGEATDVAMQCQSGEVAINGGPISWFPGVSVTLSSQFWDGVHPSGWLLTFRNDSSQTRTESFGTHALCVPGTFAVG